jgi:hypothetical protein
MSEQEREQNKKINEHSRQISDLQHRLKTIELDKDSEYFSLFVSTNLTCSQLNLLEFATFLVH